MALSRLRPSLRCHPRADGEFIRLTSDAADRLDAYDDRGRCALQEEIRATYPRATVVARDRLALVYPDPRPTWYVYRDGAVVPESAEHPVGPSRRDRAEVVTTSGSSGPWR
jgi:hypothetical protein